MWSRSGRWVVSMTTLPDGRVQLLHTEANARPPVDAEESHRFMQTRRMHSQWQMMLRVESCRRFVTFRLQPDTKLVTLQASQSQFGPNLGDVSPVTGRLVEADPPRNCPDLVDSKRYRGRVVLIDRGDSPLVKKVQKIHALGAVGGIVVDHTDGTMTGFQTTFIVFSGDDTVDVTIPVVYLLSAEGERLRTALRQSPEMEVTLSRRGRHGTGAPPPPLTVPQPTGDDTDDVTISMVEAFSADGERLRTVLRQTLGMDVTLSFQHPTEAADRLFGQRTLGSRGGGQDSAPKATAAESATVAPSSSRVYRNMWSRSGRWVVSMTTLPDGRVQLLHTKANERPPADAEESHLFMQQMIDRSRKQMMRGAERRPRAVTFRPQPDADPVTLQAGPAQFGPSLGDVPPVTGRLVEDVPPRVCPDLVDPKRYRGRVVLMERDGGPFVKKARKIQALGAVGGIVVDNTSDTLAGSFFIMSGDGTDDVTIPMVFLFSAEGERLRTALRQSTEMEVTLSRQQLVADAPPPLTVSPSGDELVQLVEDASSALAGRTEDSGTTEALLGLDDSADRREATTEVKESEATGQIGEI